MLRRLALPLSLFIAMLGLAALPSFAAGDLPTAGYLPLIFKPENTPTPLPTAPATNTPIATAVPTNTAMPTATSGPQPTATPPLPPPSFGSCATDPGASAAPNFPIKITAIDKGAETVTIRNVSASAVTITDWRICSITGGQTHAILSGSLAAGETRVIPSQAGGNIWNNSTPDPGALWTSDGRLVSYFNS